MGRLIDVGPRGRSTSPLLDLDLKNLYSPNQPNQLLHIEKVFAYILCSTSSKPGFENVAMVEDLETSKWGGKEKSQYL